MYFKNPEHFIKVQYETDIKKYGIYVRFYTRNSLFEKLLKGDKNTYTIQPRWRKGASFMDMGEPNIYTGNKKFKRQVPHPYALMIQGEFGQKLFTMWVERPFMKPSIRLQKQVIEAIVNAKKIFNERERWL
jgi:hypothetical protein